MSGSRHTKERPRSPSSTPPSATHRYRGPYRSSVRPQLRQRAASTTELADQFWRWHRLPNRAKIAEPMTAVERVRDLITEPADEHALDIVCVLVERARSSDELTLVGAGVLEVLLRPRVQGRKLVAPLIRRVRSNPRLGDAAAAVWLDEAMDPLVIRVLASLGARFPGGAKPT